MLGSKLGVKTYRNVVALIILAWAEVATMLNILARKREDDLLKAKAKKESNEPRSVHVSKAAPASNLIGRKLEHDRMSEVYLKRNPEGSSALDNLERQRRELDVYYSEKRKDLMAKLESALALGADSHLAAQKEVVWREYWDEFVPRLLDTMHHIIDKNAAIVFSTRPEATDEGQAQYAKTPDVAEGSLHEQISINVAVFLEESKKRVLQATEEQCAQLTLRSMDILARAVLNIEDYWNTKIAKDVESFHCLKMQEMSYKLDEDCETTPPHWSDSLISPQHGRRAKREKTEVMLDDSSTSTVEHDKYYLQGQRVKMSIFSAVEEIAQQIRLELFCRANTQSGEGTSQSQVGMSDLGSARDPAPLEDCYSTMAEMRKMNLEANMFHQRMHSVSLSLKAEHDSLERSLCLKESSEFGLSDADMYMGENDP